MARHQHHLFRMLEENMKDRQVYVNTDKSRLYKVACRFPMFLCVDMIHWIVSHTDPEKMVLKSVSGTQLATFRVKDFWEMYHLPHPLIMMEKPFSRPNSSANSRDILKSWVKEPTKFRTTPSQVYKTKILWNAYEFLVIFACHLYG